MNSFNGTRAKRPELCAGSNGGFNNRRQAEAPPVCRAACLPLVHFVRNLSQQPGILAENLTEDIANQCAALATFMLIVVLPGTNALVAARFECKPGRGNGPPRKPRPYYL